MIILILFRLLFVKFFITSEKSGQRFNILFSVIVGGFAGISLELLVIFSFQNIFGYVYQLIGFIIALFMLGLPLGAYISTRMMRKGDTKRKKGLIYLFSIQVIIAIISLAFPLFIRIFAGVTSIKIFIFMFTVIVGMLVGSIFPAALNLYLNEREAGKSAGIVDAFDHLGAALGAMFTGAILLPILGIAECSHLLFILALFSALLLLVNIFHPEEKKV